MASAATHMGGQPLDVSSGEASDSAGPGGLQARFAGQAGGQFADAASDATAAGFHVAIGSTLYGPADPAQLSSTKFVHSGGPTTITGTGTVNDPLHLTTTYTAGTPPVLSIVQDLSYVNGDGAFVATYSVTNSSSGAVTFRPTMAAHLAIAGAPQGYGVFVPGPPRLVSGINDVVGDGGAFQDQPPTPFQHYQEDQFSNIWAALTTGFNDTVNPALLDPGIGIQWPDTTLASGGSITYKAAVIVGGFNGMTLSPIVADQAPSTQATVTATVENHGKPAPGVPVRYTISGVSSLSGTVTSDAAGLAQISWTSTQLGADRLSAYPDSNGNGVRDAGEILRNADITWRFPKPVFGKTANISRLTGKITVNPPGPVGNIIVPGSAQVPINTIINANKGTVRLITARNVTGGTQAGNFHGGTFKVRQKKTKRRKGRKGRHHQTADLVLRGKSVSCPAHGKKASAARRRHRGRLWGNARGSFRTVGQNSAATVKGTHWLVQDSCSGTLTRVVRGTVIVQDFVHHKTVIVKKGHRYLARFR